MITLMRKLVIITHNTQSLSLIFSDVLSLLVTELVVEQLAYVKKNNGWFITTHLDQ